jgi:hypothetical protein
MTTPDTVTPLPNHDPTTSGGQPPASFDRASRHRVSGRSLGWRRHPRARRWHGFAVVLLAGCLVLSTSIGALARTPGVSHGDRAGWHADVARTISLHETANLHLVSHQGSQILHEEGRASGTLRGQLIVVIDIAYTQATVTFTAHLSNGTFSGRGVEAYYVSGKVGHFNGHMGLTGGTGTYTHATGSLQASGLIKRTHYEVVMTVNGNLKP